MEGFLDALFWFGMFGWLSTIFFTGEKPDYYGYAGLMIASIVWQLVLLRRTPSSDRARGTWGKKDLIGPLTGLAIFCSFISALNLWLYPAVGMLMIAVLLNFDELRDAWRRYLTYQEG